MSRRRDSDLDRVRRWLIRAVVITVAAVVLAPLAAQLLPMLLFLLAVAVLISALNR